MCPCPADHIRAVNPSALRVFGLNPDARNNSTASASPRAALETKASFAEGVTAFGCSGAASAFWSCNSHALSRREAPCVELRKTLANARTISVSYLVGGLGPLDRGRAPFMAVA